MTVPEIKTAIESLSIDERWELLNYLLIGVHRENSAALHHAWKDQVVICVAEIKAAMANGVSAGDALSNARVKLLSHLAFEKAAKHVFTEHSELMRRLSE